MTHKDKAQELVNKFKNELDWIEKDYTVDLYRDIRQCALIAVNEILEATKHIIDRPELCTTFYDNYWQEVKAEIEKL